MKVLVIACHVDDEILGCGGAIQKHVEQDDIVQVLIVTEAPSPEWTLEYKDQKLVEQKQVDKFLGINKRFHLNFLALSLNNQDLGRFNYHIYKKIDDIKPDIIYTHYNYDLNKEHNLVSHATLVGTRIPNKSTVYMYETPSGRYSLKPFKPNYYVELSNDHVNRKAQAFSLYKSEVKEAPHPRSLFALVNLASYRGEEVGLEYAEGFIQVRRLWL